MPFSYITVDDVVRAAPHMEEFRQPVPDPNWTEEQRQLDAMKPSWTEFDPLAYRPETPSWSDSFYSMMQQVAPVLYMMSAPWIQGAADYFTGLQNPLRRW